MDQQGLYNVIAGVCGVACGFILNNMWAMLKELQKSHGEMAVKLAEGYVPRLELEKTFDRLFKAQEEANRAMHEGFNTVREEIAHISRNQANIKTLQETITALRANGAPT